MTNRSLAGRTAVELAALVHAKDATPEEVVRAHLDAITARDPILNAFQAVRRDEALHEARMLAERGELEQLPLAGVPIAVKDDTDVAGLPTRRGSLATVPAPARADDELVARLRRAGAIIIGKTRVPELNAWPFTETLGFGATRNPWHPGYTSGGSSGGSGAALAAGMVPLAIGSDGLGSIRIPGAACGIVGLKPGSDVVPRPRDAGHAWYGLSEHGPMATSVADVALALDVMAGREDLRSTPEPDAALRIAVSDRAPVPGIVTQGVVGAAIAAIGETLRQERHAVVAADPPYPRALASMLTRRWLAGVASDADRLPGVFLEPRSRTHVRAGRLVRRVAEPRGDEARAFRDTMNGWFRDHDALLLPAIPRLPLRVGATAGRGWLTSYLMSLSYAAFNGPWNLAGFPAIVVPAGVSRRRLPVGVQIVAPRGREGVLLALARQVERARPWPRLAPVGR